MGQNNRCRFEFLASESSSMGERLKAGKPSSNKPFSMIKHGFAFFSVQTDLVRCIRYLDHAANGGTVAG